jgi:YbbR domain-containing protein
VDWKGLGEGVHPVPVKVICSDPTVTIQGTQPETLYVQLERILRQAVEVKVELQDRDQVPLGYAVDPPEVNPSFVMVEGPATAVGRVASLVASVSLAGQRTAVERTVAPRAVDEAGKAVPGLTITTTVQVKLNVQQKLNYREVTVRARTKGHPARGYFVSAVNVDPSTFTVVGPPATIAAMSGLVSVRGEVDLTGVTRLVAERMTLDLPEGVSVLTETQGEAPKVLVTVEVDAVKGGTTVEIPLKTKKLREGLVAKLSVPAVDAIITGPSVLLDDLQIELLDAYVDLTGLITGTHLITPTVDVLVSRNPKLGDLAVTDISPKSVEVTISVAPPLTPTPFFGLIVGGPGMFVTPTGTLTATLSLPTPTGTRPTATPPGVSPTATPAAKDIAPTPIR